MKSEGIREFDFVKLLKDRNFYNSTKESLKEEIKNNFISRNEPVIVRASSNTLESTLGKTLLNLFLVNVYVESGLFFNLSEFFNDDALSQSDLEKYFNSVIDSFRNLSSNVHFEDVRKKIAETIDEMSEFSTDLNYLAGDSISFHDFLRLSIEDPEVENIFYSKLPYGLQFDEIESLFKEKGKEIKKFYAKHPESDLSPFLKSGTGINPKQLTQCIGFVGLKPDIDGNVIPVNIEANYLIGLGNLENYFINSEGTRKALLTNKNMVKKSGYLTRKLSLLCMDRFHDNDLVDCGTKHFVIYSIDNEKKFKMILNRQYYDLNQDSLTKESETLRTINSDDKDFLIGKKIGLRSPVTCCGEHVCATCYGRYLSEINKNIGTGLAAVFRLTEPLTQKLLSAKHLLSTKTDKIDWGEEFKNTFTINLNAVYFSDIETDISFKIPDSDDYDEDEEMYKIPGFYYTTPDAKKPAYYQSPVDLLVNPKFISDDKITDSEDGLISIKFDEASEDDFLFHFQAKNNELVKSLMEIIELIESREHLGISNFHDFTNKFIELIIENEMDYIPAVHLEMIASTLIRDPETKRRLNFSDEILKPYEIYRVTKAILNDPLSISLAFERISDQLSNLETYKKTEKSLIDVLYE